MPSMGRRDFARTSRPETFYNAANVPVESGCRCRSRRNHREQAESCLTSSHVGRTLRICSNIQGNQDGQ